MSHRDVPLVLIELARREEPARLDQLLVKLADEGGFPDTRVSGDEDEPSGAVVHHALEGAEQGRDLGLAAIESLRNHQAVGGVMGADREGSDAATLLPIPQTALQIGRDAGGGLISLLRGLRQELHHDLG